MSGLEVLGLLIGLAALGLALAVKLGLSAYR